MATALNDDKIIGGVGIAAVVVFIIAMFAAIFVKGDFSIGTSELTELFPETIFVIGCIIAGALGAFFGILIISKKQESKLFIGRIRGILITLSGVALVLLGLSEGNIYVIYFFMALIIFAAASEMFYEWVSDQKILMVITLLLTLVIALTGILSQINDNNIIGFAFVMFISLWMIVISVMRFAPIEEKAPEKDKKKEKGKAGKKNAPAPKPYPAKKEEPPAKKKPATEKPVYKETPVKKEEPKKEEPKKEAPKKEEPKKEAPKPAPEAKDDVPKLKVMSSREAAAARDTTRKKEEPEPAPVPEPKKEAAPEPKPAPVPEPKPVPVPEPIPEPIPEPEEPEEEFDEAFEMEEDTPDSLLRRATWNKGLRCRRDYGEYQIPIAYVKAKVAVYVEAVPGDTSSDEKLRADGWTVLRFQEKDITDGKDQAEDISRAVKENLKAERASKKKKGSKK
jgi:colicin import membrane protein